MNLYMPCREALIAENGIKRDEGGVNILKGVRLSGSYAAFNP
jgi:hypothetical protein